MKTSLLTKKANSRRRSLTKRLLIIAAILVVGALLVLVVPYVLRGAVAVVWYPFDAVRVWVAESGSSLPQYLRDRTALITEIEQYKIANATERGDENTIRKLQLENDVFRTELGVVPEKRLLARVVARPNQLPYDMLMVDRGRAHGIVLNAPVFLGKDRVIGFISQVNADTALATLITSPGFVASAYVFGPNIYTETEGVGGGILRVRVPQGILLQEHNLVMMPALDSGVYGEIASIEAAPSQPEQYGYVRSAVPLQSLYYVTIGHEPMITHSFSQTQALVADVASKLFVVAVPPSELVVPEMYVGTSSAAGTTTTERRPTTTSATTTRR